MTVRDEPGLDNTVTDWLTDGKQQHGQLLVRMHVFKRIPKLSVSIRDSWDCPCSTIFHTQRERPAGRSRLSVNSHRCLDQILLIIGAETDGYVPVKFWMTVTLRWGAGWGSALWGSPLTGGWRIGKPPSSSAKRANTSPVLLLLLLLLFRGRKKLVI